MILAAALAAVRPERVVKEAIQQRAALEIAGRAVPAGAMLHVVALGKAAAQMARAVEEIAGDRIAGGLVVTRDGHAVPLAGLAVREAGHPVPDARGEAAAREVLAVARAVEPPDVLLVLLSGGTSALTSCPAAGLDLDDLASVTRALLRSGADIAEMNAVRKHLSEFSGGRLAAAAGCERIEVLLISDVPGDMLDVIGSGPCAADPTTFADALAVMRRRAPDALGVAPAIAHLERGVRACVPETPKPGDTAVTRARHTIIARNDDALLAAADAAREIGVHPVVLTSVLGGEARAAAHSLLGRIAEGRATPAGRAPGFPAGRALCFIAGGETTVTVRGAGRGGRNQELALAAAIELAGTDDAVTLLAVGTDGTDGPTAAAGAFADAGTVARGATAGVSAADALAENDSNHFFEREGGLLVTGPTGTNVMDLALVLVNY